MGVGSEGGHVLGVVDRDHHRLTHLHLPRACENEKKRRGG